MRMCLSDFQPQGHQGLRARCYALQSFGGVCPAAMLPTGNPQQKAERGRDTEAGLFSGDTGLP